MGVRDSYPPGTFCWAELSTTDQAAGKAFYEALFGWNADEPPVGDGVHHATMSLQGRAVAAIAPQPERQRAAGVPPMWNSYVSVSSADAAVARAAELGGGAHSPVFDVFDAGRMAVIEDPLGAFFEVWEPRAQRGAGLVNAPGALTWNELVSSDPERAAAFYRDLFGWVTAPFGGTPWPYLAISNGQHSAGGIRPLEGAAGPPGWLVYFGSANLDQDTVRARELGGRMVEGPTELSVGRVATLADPQGALFALFDGDFDE